MKINLLNKENSILQQFVSELRDVNVQQDRMRFRKNIERIGQIMAYEVSKALPWKEKEITTPLGAHKSQVLAEYPVLATILRAGIPMHYGFLEYFDRSDCSFISAYRKHHEDHSFEIVVEYLACPDITNRILLLVDPMLATGQSVELTYRTLLQRGMPSQLHIAGLIGSREGVNYLAKKLPGATIWLADMDDELNDSGYIIPGLGDAGDLSFGMKI
jgi:uracil phosphoribosyltransferase